jgi:hypothetical protein
LSSADLLWQSHAKERGNRPHRLRGADQGRSPSCWSRPCRLNSVVSAICRACSSSTKNNGPGDAFAGNLGRGGAPQQDGLDEPVPSSIPFSLNRLRGSDRGRSPSPTDTIVCRERRLSRLRQTIVSVGHKEQRSRERTRGQRQPRRNAAARESRFRMRTPPRYIPGSTGGGGSGRLRGEDRGRSPSRIVLASGMKRRCLS